MDDPDDPNGVHAVLHDANGNVVEVLSPATDPNDPNTAIVAHYEYDVYGNRINPLDPNDTEFEQPFRYASKWRDPDTGLVDFGRRWYFADHGRWLNRDPIGTAGGVNIYAYVMNSPVNQIDPLGLLLPCPDYLACAPTEHSFDWCPSDSGGGGDGGSPPSSQPGSPRTQPGVPGTQPATPTPPKPKPPGIIPQCGFLRCLGECAKAALEEAGSNAHILGFTLCDPSNPSGVCYCVCPISITQAGYAEAGQIVTECVRAHEFQHHHRGESCNGLDDPECAASAAELGCIAQNAARCENNLHCLEQLITRVHRILGYCERSEPPCSSANLEACKKGANALLDTLEAMFGNAPLLPR